MKKREILIVPVKQTSYREDKKKYDKNKFLQTGS